MSNAKSLVKIAGSLVQLKDAPEIKGAFKITDISFLNAGLRCRINSAKQVEFHMPDDPPNAFYSFLGIIAHQFAGWSHTVTRQSDGWLHTWELRPDREE